MKRLKMATLLLATGMVLSSGTCANAEVGFFSYDKVIDSYPAAQQAIKEIESKGLELQQFALEKQKQYKGFSTPLQQENFKKQATNDMRSKEENLAKFVSDKENQIIGQIRNAARAVMVSHKLDAVLLEDAVFVGGVDVTEEIISKLQNK